MFTSILEGWKYHSLLETIPYFTPDHLTRQAYYTMIMSVEYWEGYCTLVAASFMYPSLPTVGVRPDKFAFLTLSMLRWSESQQNTIPMCST